MKTPLKTKIHPKHNLFSAERTISQNASGQLYLAVDFSWSFSANKN